MGVRPGLSDALLAFAVISGLITLSDLAQRSRDRAEASAKDAINRQRLKTIEKEVKKLNAKL